MLGCGVHASHELPPAQRNELMKLRGNGNTDARMRIARCLGVPTGAEVRRLRDAAVVWRVVVRGNAEEAASWRLGKEMREAERRETMESGTRSGKRGERGLR